MAINPSTPPVAVADGASVNVAGPVQAAGSVLANDSDPNGLALSIAAVNGQSASVGTSVAGTYGSLILQADGTYDYVLYANAASLITPGNTVTDVFQYTLTDGVTYTTDVQRVVAQNLIPQSEAFNDRTWVKFADSGSAPTVTTNIDTGASGSAKTADRIALTGGSRGLYFQTNVAGEYTFSVWVKLVSGNGNLTIQYYKGSNDTEVQQTVVANGTWQRVSLTFTADGNANSNVAIMHNTSQTATGTFELWGAQLNPGSTVQTYVPTTGVPASTSVTESTPINVASTLTVSVTDPPPAVTTPPVAVADSAAVNVAGPTQTSGSVLGNDSDPAGLALSVATVNGQAAGVGTTIAGTYGSLLLRANGTYDYVLRSDAASLLTPGTTVTDVFQYTVTDGVTYTQTVPVITAQNLIPQSEAFSDRTWVKFAESGSAPSVTANVDAGPSGSAKTADRIALTGTDRGVYFQTNVSGTYTFSVWVKLVSGNGNLAIQYYKGSNDSVVQQTVVANGTWQRVSITFTADGNTNSNLAILHNSSQSATGTFELWGAQLNPGSTVQTYVPTTGAPASITGTQTVPITVGSTLTVNVTDPPTTVTVPPVAVADSATARVSGPTQTSGNVLGNDIDPAGRTLTVAAVNGQGAGTTVAGTYGSLLLRADGSYDYVLRSDAASLIAPGETVNDVFQYSISDGFNYAQNVSVIAAQNMLLQSEAFDDTSWVKFTDSGTNPTITSNVDTGPTGGAATADRMALTGADSGIYFQTNILGQYTFSVWVKLASGNGNLTLVYYKGSTDQIEQQTVVANGTWQRVSITFNGDGNTYSNVAIIHGDNQTATGTFELWGAQLNPGPTPQPYVPTAGHRDIQFSTSPTAANPTANLVVTVTGADPRAGNRLNFAGGKKGVVVNLANGQWSRVASVLPLGDSITYGWTSTDAELGQTNTANGYRAPLWWDFAAQSSLINFVGPNTSGDGTLPSQSHAGYPGERSDELAALLPNMLTTYQPDAVLLLAGTNDVFQELAPAAHVADMIDQMVKSVSTLSPHTHVYVATLTPINLDRVLDSGQPTDAQLVTLVNQAIVAKVAALSGAGYNVSLVDMSNITLAEIADAAHPTVAGYAHLAQNFYNAIIAQQPIVGGTPAGTANAVAAGVTSVVGSEANDLLIGGSGNVTLAGGGGNDRLVAGSGTDVLTGGSGADQFVFRPTSGSATITDFSPTAGDLISFEGFSALTQFSQLAGHIQQVGADTLIDLTSFGVSTVIDLANFSGTLGSQNFLFHT